MSAPTTALTAVTNVAPASLSCARGSAAAGADVAGGGRVEWGFERQHNGDEKGAEGVVNAVAEGVVNAVAAPLPPPLAVNAAPGLGQSAEAMDMDNPGKSAGANQKGAPGSGQGLLPNGRTAAVDTGGEAGSNGQGQAVVAAVAKPAAGADAPKAAGDALQHQQHLVLQQLRLAATALVLQQLPVAVGVGVAAGGAALADFKAKQAAAFVASTTTTTNAPTLPVAPAGKGVLTPAAKNEALFAKLDQKSVGTSQAAAPSQQQQKPNVGSLCATAAVTPLINTNVGLQQQQHLQQRTAQPV